MTPTAAFLLLATAAAVTAALVTRRRPEHRPVALWLALVAALAPPRLAFAQLLPAGQGPYEGWQVLVRHLDAGAYLALCWAMAALLGVGVFLRRER